MVSLEMMMRKAISLFEQQAHVRERISMVCMQIRSVCAQEMSVGQDRAAATFRIEYAIDGDYTESDNEPYLIRVVANGKQIEARRVG